MTKVISLPRYDLKWAKSKKLLEAQIEAYNQDKPLGEQLRSAHRKLMEYMLYLYSLTLKKHQAYGPGLEPGASLPPLRTNNEQLAGEMGCSTRTIINLRDRLAAAGLITADKWRGTNSSYELAMSFNIIQLERRGDPTNLVRQFAPPLSASPAVALAKAGQSDEALSKADQPSPQDAGATPPPPQKNQAPTPPENSRMAKTLRHTVSREHIQDTNELIELSGVDFQKTSDFQADTNFSNVESCGKRPKSVENTSENPQLVNDPVTQDTFTGYTTGRTPAGTRPPSSAAPPRDRRSLGEGGPKPPAGAPAPPETLVEVVEGLPDEQIRAIGRHVDAIWNAAAAELYADKWICDQERARARARIAEYFIYARPDRYTAGAAEILERIMLVSKWIQRGQAQEQNRWVPLPSIYFDYRNERNGFTRTKAWYKEHLQAKREIKDNEILTKAIKEYLRSQEDGAPIGPAETYRRIAQRLGKRSKQLLNRFHESINPQAA